MADAMSDPRLAAFPPPLRGLVEAELAAGNSIMEIGNGFPAPPVGAYVKLARAVTTRERRSSAELSFYDRHSSLYSGEWTEARRFFFVLEPPRSPDEPPPLPPSRPSAPAASASPAPAVASAPDRPPSISSAFTAAEAGIRARLLQFCPSDLVRRFRDSMKIDYEKWHDGIGYDLSLLGEATPDERREIERIVLGRGARDWRDVEALAALNTQPARQALAQALVDGDATIRGAVLRYRPDLVDEEQKRAHLVAALRTAEFYHGLTEALDAVVDFHPPEVLQEVFRGALERRGSEAVHFAGLLLYLFGQAEAPFDWAQRPFLLRFATPERGPRQAAFVELCGRIGVDSQPYLDAAGTASDAGA